MTILAFLERLVAALQRADVPYMITGSFASAAHGTPRATNDIDVVIAPSPAQLQRLLEEFPETNYYASREAAFDALERHSQFNIIDFETGWKADLIVRRDRSFSRVEFERRQRLAIGGVSVVVASPEDVLLSKLESAREGGSERQISDAAGILRQQGVALDREYVSRWVEELALEAEWRKVLAVAEE
jgi:hypothetical protein